MKKQKNYWIEPDNIEHARAMRDALTAEFLTRGGNGKETIRKTLDMYNAYIQLKIVEQKSKQ